MGGVPRPGNISPSNSSSRGVCELAFRVGYGPGGGGLAGPFSIPADGRAAVGPCESAGGYHRFDTGQVGLEGGARDGFQARDGQLPVPGEQLPSAG
jgi:hypothetical protein